MGVLALMLGEEGGVEAGLVMPTGTYVARCGVDGVGTSYDGGRGKYGGGGGSPYERR